MQWDEYFLRIAEVVAQKSKDRRKKIGAVIVGEGREIRSTGFNGFPRGVNDDGDERHARPANDLWTDHAERTPIVNAAPSPASALPSTSTSVSRVSLWVSLMCFSR